MTDPELFLVDQEARLAAFDAIAEAARVFELERRLTLAEREAIVAKKLAAARRGLSPYDQKEADIAFERAVDAVMEEITSTSIERAAAGERPEFPALTPEEGAALLLERRRAQ